MNCPKCGSNAELVDKKKNARKFLFLTFIPPFWVLLPISLIVLFLVRYMPPVMQCQKKGCRHSWAVKDEPRSI